MAYYASSMINHPFLFLRIFPSAFPSVRFLAAACRFCISNKQSQQMYVASNTAGVLANARISKLSPNFRPRVVWMLTTELVVDPWKEYRETRAREEIQSTCQVFNMQMTLGVVLHCCRLNRARNAIARCTKCLRQDVASEKYQMAKLATLSGRMIIY